MKKCLHMLILVSVLLLPGCAIDLGPAWRGAEMVLTVRCDESPVTKAGDSTQDGEKRYNENLIRSVDFFFYPGANPGGTEESVYHIRRELEEDPMPVDNKWEVPFNLVLTKDIIGRIFTTNQATVYALVNFEQSFVDTLSHTTLNYLASIRFTTDFAQNETAYKQPCFIMDGKEVLTYSESGTPSVQATIDVTRFASKVTLSIKVENSVVLKHDPTTDDADETWTPVLHTMRVYLVDGVKTVLLSGEDDDPAFFSYSSIKRPYVKNDGAVPPTPYVSKTDDYYDTYPMYTYPYKWETNVQKDTDHLGGKYNEPYLKLEMDWTRQPDQHYTFDQRKYYYKVFLPFDEFERNHWYSLSLDLGILGSETDEGKALLKPSCYILDWQNISEVINKYAVISKARYLSVEKEVWELNNVNEITIPILSSHIVDIDQSTIKVTRPYYGEIKTGLDVGDYHPQYHAWIRQKETDGKVEYYLDYVAKAGETRPAADEQKYNPVNWLSNTSTIVKLQHDLENDYTSTSFDYSPYTIDFYIGHDDLKNTHTYEQYLRHIRIIQYPAIYIVATRNSDTAIKVIDGNSKKIPAGYEPRSDQPWRNYPWGYVYVNGGRFLRQYSATNYYPLSGPHEPYYDLTDANSQKEYQWQAVWYTGGGRDMFEINVTVLPATSNFVIGDPRTKEIDNLAPTANDPTRYASMYTFTPANEKDKNVLITNFSNTSTTSHYGEDGSRTGFAYAPVAPSIRKEGDGERTLMYYHPTDKSSRTTNMLAPSFRFASKFGGTEFGEITREAAEYRCAAYQEDGFPAGRWRLPTKAEIKFVVQLSANEAFEHLFEYNKSYWAAQGGIIPRTNHFDEVNPATALLRCVYDSWYWGDTQETPRNIFYWGDKE